MSALVGQVGALGTMLGGAGVDGSAGGLLECFAAITDPRDRRGIRHSLPSILGLATAAVVSGQQLLDDITAWITAADPLVLAAFECRRDTAGGFIPPHEDTVQRLFALLQAQQVADQVGVWLARRAGIGPVGAPIDGPGWLPAIAVDGKAVRGAVDPDGQVPYLLAAATHTNLATHERSVVLTERLIGAKTNEVPEFAPLLRGLDHRVGGLGGCVVTVDAAHTVRTHARLLTEELGAHYVMTVKQNTPKVYATIDALDWANTPITHETLDIGHGRHDRRTIRVRDAPDDLGFPGAKQVFLIERYSTRTVRKRRKGSRRYKKVTIRTAVAVLGVTSLSEREAAPEHLAGYIRGHWSIENKIHWVRDVTFREDASPVRKAHKFRIMATLRNLTTG
ncbi:ISAs1 family transposase [Pseudonocardia sp. NPDC046786]|uniref:ISAs1 family transposase n=1 Tax=Pseudonocardia sp. NPDC046786 TaxID=3155471 RepID=UPI0033E5F7BA